MRPEAANTMADPGIVNRIWDDIYSRLFAPITLLWIFALSTGQGVTAKVFRSRPVSEVLAPTGYACFLFHQIIGQWYFAITRHGEWWNWWTHRKAFYWFSPQPVPIEWYEYFYVVGLVVIFAKMVQPLEPWIRRSFKMLVDSLRRVSGNSLPGKDTTTEILEIIERATGLEVQPEWNLAECGLASLGIAQFTNTLQTEFSAHGNRIVLQVADILAAQDIRAIAAIIDAAKQDAAQQAGVFQVS